jgi:hypothetical protein
VLQGTEETNFPDLSAARQLRTTRDLRGSAPARSRAGPFGVLAPPASGHPPKNAARSQPLLFASPDFASRAGLHRRLKPGGKFNSVFAMTARYIQAANALSFVLQEIPLFVTVPARLPARSTQMFSPFFARNEIPIRTKKRRNAQEKAHGLADSDRGKAARSWPNIVQRFQRARYQTLALNSGWNSSRRRNAILQARFRSFHAGERLWNPARSFLVKLRLAKCGTIGSLTSAESTTEGP